MKISVTLERASERVYEQNENGKGCGITQSGVWIQCNIGNLM